MKTIILKNVPIPATSGILHCELRRLIARTQIGDSFVIPAKSSVTKIYRFAKLEGRVITTRKVKEGNFYGVRVWIIK